MISAPSHTTDELCPALFHWRGVSAREFAALGLVFVSGAAGLSHQIIWTRRLVDILGASADTFSKVVGAFFLGLALGAWVASRKPGDGPGAWRRVAWAEGGVAALSLPILFSIHGIDSLPVQPGPWIKWILPSALVTPPALAIGLILPWAIRALSTEPGFQASLVLWLYCLNTLGAVLGIGGVVFVGLPAFGLQTAGLIAAGLNIVVAAGAFTLHRLRRAPVPVEKGETASASQLTGRQKALAFFSGFLVLSLEVLLQHQFAQVTVNSFFSSATVLALVLSTLTVAAAVAPGFLRFCGGWETAMHRTLVLSVVACLAQPFLFLWMQSGLRIIPYELTGAPYAWEVMKLGLFVVGPLFFTAGLIFPLLLQHGIGGDGRLIGRQIGLLLAINGAGGWLGAELTQGFLAPTFGLWRGVVFLGAVYGLLALLPIQQARRKFSPLKTTLLSGLGMVLLAGAWFGSRQLPQAYLERGQRLVELGVSRDGVVATLIDRSNDWRILFNNTYTLGGSKAQFNQERQAHLPLVLHGHAKSVALLGVATGSTTAGAALHTDVESIDALELCGLVLDYAEKHFAPFNRDVFRNPRVRMIHEDARWWIAGRQDSYDVVIGDLFLPWRTGEGRLFSREHFRAVRRSLKTNGIFCQWLPLFQLTRPQYDVIVRTFREVFPDAYLIRGDFYTELPIVGLVGGRALSAQPWELTAQACARLRLAGDVTDALVRHVEGVAMMIVGPLPDPGPGPANTLGNAWLEWNAGRNILGMKAPWFIGVPCAEYVRDIQRESQLLLPTNLRDAHDAGQFFLTLEIAAKLNLPVLADLKAQVPQRTPASLRQDTAADWQQWPMRVKPEFNVKP